MQWETQVKDKEKFKDIENTTDNEIVAHLYVVQAEEGRECRKAGRK
jgi:hypothetical protein